MAMAKRLLDRQASLLDYLSSTAAMFGPQTNAPADPALRALDAGVLRLQARFICNKRMEKIVALFPRTLDIMGVAQRAVLREFVETSRSTQRSSLANAREFHAFLARRWRRSRPRPAYLPDVAACELAMAEVRHVAEDHDGRARDGKRAGPRRAIRRRRNVAPLRCAYDVRAMLDAAPPDVVPRRRAISLVVTTSPDRREVRIVQATSRLVDILSRLRDWTAPSVLDTFGDRETLLADLAASKFTEERS